MVRVPCLLAGLLVGLISYGDRAYGVAEVGGTDGSHRKTGFDIEVAKKRCLSHFSQAAEVCRSFVVGASILRSEKPRKGAGFPQSPQKNNSPVSTGLFLTFSFVKVI